MDDVKCVGSERTLIDCVNSKENTCNPGEEASVECSGNLGHCNFCEYETRSTVTIATHFKMMVLICDMTGSFS